MAPHRTSRDLRRASLLAVALTLGLEGCSFEDEPGSLRPEAVAQTSSAGSEPPTRDVTPSPSPSAPSPEQSAAPSPIPSATTTPAPGETPTPTATPTRRPAVTGMMSIPALGVRGLKVVPYRGTTDDAAGTRIQNRGVAASPRGSTGGVGPGEVGNYLVTGHRLSAGGVFRELPRLRNGDTVTVTSDGVVYTYVISGTRETSFRSTSSLARQRAAVPGYPGRRATKAMITISTCATLEDHAAGNYWSDEFDNPEHRIDKIGVLRSSRVL
ncbi:class E sortase [Motilibacter deserti]|uniref:Class E sortase n=1 Tax=Motilibacter deserti TaxID=2714956 RepID=A0ABX0GZ92_9ACTN|nr:class E sortase [Motilibacter deserti]NHC14909.1 class E sortase [Motilibacter deserti]